MWREQVEERGFAIIPELLEPPEAERLLEQLPQTALQRTRAGARHALAHPAVAALARDSRLLDLARDVLGGAALPFRATLFDKSPDANWLVVWHQDTALPLRQRQELPGWGPWSVKAGVAYAHAPDSVLTRILALRIHLDDSTIENGPLRVLPGSHRLGVLSDDSIEAMTAQMDPVECLIPRGGALLMRPLIVHASSKSKSRAPRRVLHIEYAASLTLEHGLELAVT